MELQDRLTLQGAEGIDIEVVLAGLGSRTAAAVIDLVIQGLVLVGIAAVSAMFGDAGVALIAVGSLLVIFGYPIAAETFANGQTVGKRVMNMAVVAADGTPVTFMASTIRNVVRMVDLLPGNYLVGAVAVFASKRNQRLGDIAATTIVIQRPKPGAHLVQSGAASPYTSVPGSTMEPVLSPEVAGWDVSSVTAEEIAAIRTFLLRRHSLDPSHRADLAQTLAFQILPKVAGVPLEGGPELFLERIAASRAY